VREDIGRRLDRFDDGYGVSDDHVVFDFRQFDECDVAQFLRGVRGYTDDRDFTVNFDLRYFLTMPLNSRIFLQLMVMTSTLGS